MLPLATVDKPFQPCAFLIPSDAKLTIDISPFDLMETLANSSTEQDGICKRRVEGSTMHAEEGSQLRGTFADDAF